MSIRFATMNSPAIVAGAGTALLVGLPFLQTAATSAATTSLGILKGSNALAFVLNAISVSVPGRMDGQQDEEMRHGVLNPSKPPTSETPLVGDDSSTRPSSSSSYTVARTRSIVNPAGWAFAIWGPIYLGELVFVGAQLFSPNTSALVSILPQVTVPFVAANVFQSLWCASFRPSYSHGWKKYVSVGMLGCTALSLSQVQAAAAVTPDVFWYLLPMSMHFGWTTAATLVNLNGSIAMEASTSDSTVVAAGHASSIAATALGVGITLAQSAPAYGLTVAWALAACAQGTKRVSTTEQNSDSLKKGANIQKNLCWVGSAACLATSIISMVV